MTPLVAVVSLVLGLAPPSGLWDDVVHPGRIRCQAATRQAQRLIGPNAVDTAKARALLESARARCPEDLEVRATLGGLLLELGDRDGARLELESARRLSPDGQDGDARLSMRLGYLRLAAGEPAAALVELRRAEAQGPLAEDAWVVAYNIGDALMALGRLGEAIDSYKRALPQRIYRSDDRRPIVAYALAVALDRADEPERARSTLQTALIADPQLHLLQEGRYVFQPPGEVHYYRFLAYRARGRTVDARRALERFLRDTPDSPYAAHARDQLRRLAAPR